MKSGQDKVPTSMSAGRALPLVHPGRSANQKRHLGAVEPWRRRGRPAAYAVSGNASQRERSQISPGSRGPVARGPHWVAYVSDESGRNEVYVREFLAGRDGRQVADLSNWRDQSPLAAGWEGAVLRSARWHDPVGRRGVGLRRFKPARPGCSSECRPAFFPTGMSLRTANGSWSSSSRMLRRRSPSGRTGRPR